MSESAIRTQIYTILSGVTDIGQVYDYERWSADWNTFVNFFKTKIDGTDQIRGWEIGRKAPCGDSGEDHGTIRIHTYFIRGYMGLKDSDASEKTFNLLIEAICEIFRPAGIKELNGAAIGTEYIKVEALEARMFGNVLCHFVEMTLTVYEQIN